MLDKNLSNDSAILIESDHVFRVNAIAFIKFVMYDLNNKDNSTFIYLMCNYF
jgi:hypothetical protein